MQMERAKLDLQEQQAKVRKAQADADKAEAEAAKAMAEASMVGVNPHSHAPLSQPIEMPRGAPDAMAVPAGPITQESQNYAPSGPQVAISAPAPTFEQGPVSPEQLAPDQGLPAA